MSSSGTIAAIASPAGPARRGLIRLSGPDTRAILEASVSVAVPPERAALRGRFDDGTGEQPLLLFWMPGPTSYTREDVAELHLPGNPRLLDRALERVLALGARPALHGEFSRRAFLGGRIDLTRAEGILELVAASNESERRAATGLLAGGLERRILDLREALDDARALVEASLDFDSSETGHVPEEELGRRLDEIGERLREALRWEVRRQAPSALPRALLHGAPNAGKSSLFNALVGGGAIVSDLEGTTRDTLSGLWSLPGGACLLLDAPGLDRLAGGPIARPSAWRPRSGSRSTSSCGSWTGGGPPDPGSKRSAGACRQAARGSSCGARRTWDRSRTAGGRSVGGRRRGASPSRPSRARASRSSGGRWPTGWAWRGRERWRRAAPASCSRATAGPWRRRSSAPPGPGRGCSRASPWTWWRRP